MLAYFNINAPTFVISDANPVGLGAVLLQTQEDGAKKSVACASWSLTPTVLLSDRVLAVNMMDIQALNLEELKSATMTDTTLTLLISIVETTTLLHFLKAYSHTNDAQKNC